MQFCSLRVGCFFFFFLHRGFTFTFARKIEWLVTLIQARPNRVKVVLYFGWVSILWFTSGPKAFWSSSNWAWGVLQHWHVSKPHCHSGPSSIYLLPFGSEKLLHDLFSSHLLVSVDSPGTALQSLPFTLFSKLENAPRGRAAAACRTWFQPTPVFFKLYSVKALLPWTICDAFEYI